MAFFEKMMETYVTLAEEAARNFDLHGENCRVFRVAFVPSRIDRDKPTGELLHGLSSIDSKGGFG